MNRNVQNQGPKRRSGKLTKETEGTRKLGGVNVFSRFADDHKWRRRWRQKIPEASRLLSDKDSESQARLPRLF